MTLPFVNKLVDKGELQVETFHDHRFVNFQEVIDYKNSVDTARLMTLDELTRQAQELNMGYN